MAVKRLIVDGVGYCLVLRPQYFAAVNRFRSHGLGEKWDVCLGYVTEINLTSKAWEKAVQELGNLEEEGRLT